MAEVDPAARTAPAALAALQQGARRLAHALGAPASGWEVEVAATLDSTNAELLRRARAGVTRPTVLAAAAQTAGRGRRGRPWVTLPGQSLAFSVGLPLAPADWSGLSLVVGVAVAQALPTGVRLKWPNDLWWQGRKLGGILIETAGAAGSGSRYAVIGVGVNLATPALPPDAALDALPPAGLHELPGTAVDPGAWLAVLAPAVVQAVRRFEQDGFAPWQARYGALDALAGRPVRTSDGVEGVADGVDADGALRLRTAQGLRRVQAGEVSVRPC
ncbi:Bifunctional ligase/repressor BirA [Tepidimonas sediminis]|uniref:biotin--[biotin carboxyl-carrier protein] ligase n=1 Tax=Tepidimonas sediminis TaxID=2588941 RepID=A0A554WL71_9BURK|nr:biotin--[acetyl-CoA-carboxylase] ligase [Tepidimonas sediminis]TSE24305.1 Bifunctional ligase/repressor BirA [Tepidimonas sediminis]